MSKKLYRVCYDHPERNWFVVAKSEESAKKKVFAEYEVAEEESVYVYEYEGVVEVGSTLFCDG
jgi:hypothetical protein